MTRSKRLLAWVSFFILTVLAFENCGKPILRQDVLSNDEVTEFQDPLPEEILPEVSTGDKCEDIYLNEFLRTDGYYSFVRRQDKCLGCHDGSNTVAPYFAHSNKLMAFEKFREKEILGNHSISARAVSNHQPGITGDMNVNLIDELRLGFVQIQQSYEDCKGIVSIDLNLKTAPLTLQKAIANNALTADEQTLKPVTAPKLENGVLIKDAAGKVIMLTFNLNSFQRLVYSESAGYKIVDLKKYSEEIYSFDLSKASYTSDVQKDEPIGSVSIRLKPVEKIVETKRNYGTYSVLVGVTQTLQNYLVASKPSFKLPNQTAAEAWSFQNLSFLINDAKVESATIYNILDANICGPQEITLMEQNNSALLVFDKLVGTDELKLQLKLAKAALSKDVVCSQNSGVGTEPLPATMTWTELTSATGVFGKNCLSCHSGTSPSGGLNLGSYDVAKSKASVIMSRMNDTNNPMPRSGLLDQRQRDLVQLWINKGMPR